MKKLLWLSRHEMTKEQLEALGDVSVTQIPYRIGSAYELVEEINDADIIALVAPINLQEQFLKLAKGKPVLIPNCERYMARNDLGEEELQFKFNKWEQLHSITVEKSDYVVANASEFNVGDLVKSPLMKSYFGMVLEVHTNSLKVVWNNGEIMFMLTKDVEHQ